MTKTTHLLAADLEHILDHTRDLWDELRGQRIFITGGTGFFGRWLLESFAFARDRLHLGAVVEVLTRNPGGFRAKAPHLAAHPAIRLRLGDIRQFDFPGGSFSHVIHAATESSGPLAAENPLLMLDTIVQGTRRVLDFASQAGVKKLLLTSSGAVYGRQPSDFSHIPEDYAGAPGLSDPRSVYGEGKRFAELLCTIYGQGSGIETKIARGFAFVGPYLPLDAHFAIGNFIRDGLRGGPIVVKGDGTPYRSYLYAADLAIWLWTILIKGKPDRPYNVGSDRAVCIADLARTVAGTFAPAPAVQISHSPEPGKLADRYAPDINRAKNELGLDAWIDLEESILRTVAWARRCGF